MQNLEVVKTKNDVFKRGILNVCRCVAKMEENEMNQWSNEAEDNEDLKCAIQDITVLRNQYHKLLHSYLDEICLIRMKSEHISDMKLHILLKKLDPQHKKYAENVEKHTQKIRQQKLKAEIEYEKTLSKIWDKVFNLLRYKKAAAEMNRLNTEYILEDLRECKSFIDEFSEEFRKCERFKEKMDVKMCELYVKCGDFELTTHEDEEKDVEDVDQLTDEAERVLELFDEEYKEELTSLFQSYEQIKEKYKSLNVTCEKTADSGTSTDEMFKRQLNEIQKRAEAAEQQVKDLEAVLQETHMEFEKCIRKNCEHTNELELLRSVVVNGTCCSSPKESTSRAVKSANTNNSLSEMLAKEVKDNDRQAYLPDSAYSRTSDA